MDKLKFLLTLYSNREKKKRVDKKKIYLNYKIKFM